MKRQTSSAMEVVQESIYDHPRWYDMVFGTDCAAELKFIEACAAQYCQGKVRRLFEPACGTGRLILRFAKRGYDVSGLDLNPHAIEFCNDRLKRAGYKPSTWVADMSDFTVKKLFDVAFNTINSFRHLATEEAARKHLECMATAVRTGGLYLLGLHLTPTKGTPSDNEGWSARRGHLSINTWMWPIDKNPRKRMECFGIRFDVRTPTKHLRIEDQLHLRSYTAAQMNRLLESVPQWEVAGTYDFGYDMKQPITIDALTEDIVYVLRRREA